MDKKDKRILQNISYVQCPFIPQVATILDKIKIPTIRRGSGLALDRLNYLEKLYREWVKDIVDLSDFKHCYFVNGVTDAINQWIATENRPWQYFDGDYEYANLISSKGTKVKHISNTDLLYVSNPACSSGNFIDLEDIDNPVVLDCAYVGSTKKRKIFVPKNTEQIWFSFSKGWGLIGQRAGLVFTKQTHQSLHVMKNVEAWNYTGVEIALAMVTNFDIDFTYDLYKKKQQKICRQFDLSPADCFFIGNSTHEDYAMRRRVSDIARLNLCHFLV